MSARFTLRAATRAAHDRVDAAYSRWDLGQRADYIAFLSAQARAFLPAEQAIAEGAAVAGLGDWPRRAPLLVADLADLDSPAAPGEPMHFATPAALLGAAYVLEGSRLGGAMLARLVAPGLPTRFLAPPDAPGRWRDFQAMLDRRLASDDDRAEAVAGARMTFDQFLDAVLEPAD